MERDERGAGEGEASRGSWGIYESEYKYKYRYVYEFISKVSGRPTRLDSTRLVDKDMSRLDIDGNNVDDHLGGVG
jgi:hypothetical protein